MKTERPQITQMNADKETSVTICVNLRYLRCVRCRDESSNSLKGDFDG